MTITREQIEAEKAEILKQRETLINQVNVSIGFIAAYDRVLELMEKPEAETETEPKADD